MKHNHKPALLVLTSSFPCSPDDETCGYIRDFARSLCADFNVTVLAPPDKHAVEWPIEGFKLIRSRSFLPLAVDPFQAGSDLNHLVSGSLLAKLAALMSLGCFFARALALALQADAICSHWLVPSGVMGASISRLLAKPHIAVEHSGALHLLTRIRGGRTIAGFIVRSSNRIVTVSADLKRKLIALCPAATDRVEVIPMGVNACSAADSQTIISLNLRTASLQTSTILFIGRLAEIKGLDVLLKAMSGLESLRLIVAGDGECRDELERQALSLSVNARFISRIGASERERLLSVCDAVVIPSRVLPDGRTEGTPVVCLEAMAAGRAVIASRVGGLAELIVDGENGLLFDQDDYQMLREKLVHLLNDDRLRRRIEETARSAAAAYEWPRTGIRYSAIVQRALRDNDAIDNRRIEAGSCN